MKRYFQKKKDLVLIFSFIASNLFSQTFVEQTGISLSGVIYSSISWGDYDNDGDLDILLTGSTGPSNISKIYRNDAGVFTEINAGLTGISYSSVSWGDYDNDGDLDILLTGYTGSTYISKIYRNDAGVFTDINAGLTGVDKSSVAWGDYDNDGDLDVLLTGYTGSGYISKIYRNEGGAFTDIIAGITGVGNSSVSWCDYNNDGNLDILLTGFTGSSPISKIYRNDAGVFTDINAGLTGVSGSSVAWGDFDNDGDLDILLTGSSGSGYISKIYRNDAGVFTDINAGLTGVNSGSVAWGDCDNDGDLDILLTGYGYSKIYRNDAGVFTDINAGLAAVEYSSVSWGDYDKDGDLDILLTGSYYSTNVSKIYRNNIATANTIPAAPSNLKSNITGTGVALSWNKANDIQTIQNGLSYNVYLSTTAGNVNKRSPMAALPGGYRKIVQRGVIQGNTWTIKKLPAGTYYWSVQAIDNCFAGSVFATETSFVIPFTLSVSPVSEQTLGTNQNGTILTVTESNTPSSRQWKYSTVSGGPYNQTISGSVATTYTPNFPAYGTYYVVCESVYNTVTYTSNEIKITVSAFTEQTGIILAGIYDGSVAWGDYDNDGDLDILLTGMGSTYISKIYRNDAGVFTDINAGLTGVVTSSVAWGDYNNDGYLDILITGTSNGSATGAISKIYRNNGDNTFTEQTGSSIPGVYNSSVAWGDYDNDGDLDILMIGYNSNLGSISKIYCNDAGIFTDINAGLPGLIDGSVAWGDYDNDGDLDILLTGHTNSFGVDISRIYQNNNGVFTDIKAGLTEVPYSSAAWGDYDNDGDLDILLTGSSGSGYISKIYRNDAGVFTDINAGLTGVWHGSVAWGDYDNDGDLDILLTGSTDISKVSKIYRNDAGVFTDINAGLIGAEFSSVAWGDYDNDRDLDILLTGSNSGAGSKIYRNNTAAPNTLPGAPTNLQTSVAGSGITLSWNKPNDSQTVQNGLSYNVYIGTAAGTANKRSPMTALPGGFRRIVQKGVIQGNSWTIKKLPAGTYYWSVQAIDNCFAGSAFAPEGNFTLLFSNSISPAADQKLIINQNGSALTVTESNTPASRQWKYSTVSGGPYNQAITGATGTIYTPRFLSFGTWYVVCESVYNTVTYTSNEVKINVPVFTEQAGINIAGVNSGSISWGDYDNDGDLDILLTGTSGTGNISKIYRNDVGVFTDINAGLTGVSGSSFDWGDYDNDGDLDILLTGNSGSSKISKIYRNDSGVLTDINAGLTGVWLGSVAWGDYDNDGDQDIILTGSTGTGNFSKIYRNDAGIFTDINVNLPGVSSGSVSWGDYDNDGDLDILLTGDTGSSNVSKIYRNDSGVFTDINAGLTGVSNSYAAWGDYDNDGDLDILLTGVTGLTSFVTKIYRNDAGSFKDIGASLNGVLGTYIAWGDYDNDGDLDILFTGESFEESPSVKISRIYRNDSGVFTDIGADLTGFENSKVAWGDYDNDGDLDILLTGYTGFGSGYISKIYRNNITTPNTVPTVPSNLQSSVTGSGITTLTWNKTNDSQTSQNGLSYNIYVGTIAGKVNKRAPMAALPGGYRRIVQKGLIQGNSWTINRLTPGTYYWSVQAIDNCLAGSAFATEASFVISYTLSVSPVTEQTLGINQNGTPLTVTESSTPTTRQWKYSTVSGGPYNQTVTGSTGTSYTPNFSAFGTYFVVCESVYSTVTYTSNEVRINVPAFSEQTGILLAGVNYSSVSWGDYDNDGDFDILLTGYSSSGLPASKIYRYESGVFTDINAGLNGIYMGSVAWGDYDNDGDLDILLTGFTGSTYLSKIYHNDAGVFTDINAGLTGVYYSSVSWGDYDNDGDLDILLTGSTGSSYISKIYRNDNGVFTDINVGLTGVYIGSVAWGDYDNDGDLDILLTGNTGSIYVTKLYRNDSGLFTDINAGLTGAARSSISWGDYDNDGDLDILLTGYNSSSVAISKIYRNDTGVFTDINAGLTGVYFSSVSWSDFDDDGDLDILLSGNTGSTYVSKIYRNDAGVFTEINTGLTGVYNSSVVWGDYDKDGDLDILMTGNSGSGYISKIYKNNSTTPNTIPAGPSNLQSNVTGTGVKLTWNKANDAQTAQNGLSYNLYIGTSTGTVNKRSPMAELPGGYRRIIQKGVIQGNSWTIKKLIPGTYYWSVQAIDNAYAGGTWATESTFVLLIAPVATPATSVNQKSFVANWNRLTGASGYYLDIATDTTFTTIVTGYNNLDVGNVSSISITGLIANTLYYYRVRAYNLAGTSISSGTITVTTLLNPNAIIDISGTKSLRVFPNPASTSFDLNLNSSVHGKIIISLYNSSGIKMLEYRTEKLNPELNCQIPVAGLQNGIYSVEVSVNDRKIGYLKIVILK